MTARTAQLLAILSVLSATASRAEPAPSLPATAPIPADDTLTLLSVDVRTLPGAGPRREAVPAPRWRTSFGSERRSEPAVTQPSSGVDADIVLLQGVTDVPTLRRWFPAGQWRLVASRQLIARPETEANALAPAPPIVPSTAVAIRLRRGLRITAQIHLTELADAHGSGHATPAGTAVRVMIDNRETWAVSVDLPENCAEDCPGRAALGRWSDARATENVRRVTGGRFKPDAATSSECGQFGLRLDPPPPAPRPGYTLSTLTPDLGCAASVSVAK